MSSSSTDSDSSDTDLDPLDPAHTTYSTLTSTSSSASHVLNVDCYAATKALVPTGTHLRSSSFPGGRYSSWHLAYFPNGDCAERADHVSILLVLDGTDPAASVSADFTVSLLDEAGEVVPSHSESSSHQFFDGNTRHPLVSGPLGPWRAGFPEFIRRETLEQSDHLRDDRFSIRCDVVVHEIRSVATGPPEASSS